jgi:hypothetical protein
MDEARPLSGNLRNPASNLFEVTVFRRQGPPLVVKNSPTVLLLSLPTRQLRYRLPPPVLRYPLTSPFRERPAESTCRNASRFVTSYLRAYAIGKTGLVIHPPGRAVEVPRDTIENIANFLEPPPAEVRRAPLPETVWKVFGVPFWQ